MRNTNCRNVRREIEEIAESDLLSSSAKDHLKNCPQCGTFREERLKLREMLSSLGAVEAPGDFDYRLRARLANEKRGGSRPFVMRNLSFGFRSSAFATILLLIGSAFLFIRFSNTSDSPLSADASKPQSTATDIQAIKQPENAGSTPLNPVAHAPQADQPGVTEKSLDAPPVHTQRRPNRRAGLRGEVASLRNNPRLSTRDSSSTEAPIFRPVDAVAADGSSVFPIAASFQSLKVSLDDGRGSSRTISLPSVSFGSQRVLAQGSSPLLASARSARSDW